jgi:hypothetical protein
MYLQDVIDDTVEGVGARELQDSVLVTAIHSYNPLDDIKLPEAD